MTLVVYLDHKIFSVGKSSIPLEISVWVKNDMSQALKLRKPQKKCAAPPS